jgi:peptide/nickel transport system substrate-binding protein
VWGLRDPGRGDFPVKVGRYFVSLLKGLGYRASLKLAPPDEYFSSISDSRARVQIGFYGWAADYPAASNFINSLFSCDSFVPATTNQVNVSEFCDPRIDAEIKRALTVQASDPTASGDLWAEIERQIVDQAPWVSLHTAKAASLVSKRVGNYQYNLQWGPLFDQFWVR